MKIKIKIALLVFSLGFLIFSSCNKEEDLLTANAKTGGLIFPTTIVAYLLGATPKVEVSIDIPQGPGISKIEVYKQYIGKADTVESNRILFKTMDINSENGSKDLKKNLSFTYNELISGLKVKNVDLPADENLIPIGDAFILDYIAIMNDGSRKVVSNISTSVDIANRWVGSYLMKAFTLRQGDPVLTGNWTADWKLATVDAKSVIFSRIQLWADGSTVGGIGPWILTMDASGGPDNPQPVTVSDLANPAVKNNPADDSRYDPKTKTFYISVFWGNGPTHRAARDTLIYTGPF